MAKLPIGMSISGPYLKDGKMYANIKWKRYGLFLWALKKSWRMCEIKPSILKPFACALISLRVAVGMKP